MRWLVFGLLAAAQRLELEDSSFDKVLELLDGMRRELLKEKKDDEDGQKELTSWCQSAGANQSRIISESTSLLETQHVVVTEGTAMGERLELELRSLGKEIASNEATLAKAEALREDQRLKFEKDTKSLRDDISAVSQALGVMGPSLLQSPFRLREVVEKHYESLRRKTSKGDRMLLMDFLKDPARFTKGLGFLQKHGAEASGPADTVAGMLQAMADDFKADLKEEEEEDGKLEKSYQALVAAKVTQVTAGKEQVALKEQQKADYKQKVISGKEDIRSAVVAKAEAEDFLRTSRAKCVAEAEGFRERSGARQEELAAISKAGEVLEGKSSKPLSFLQLALSHEAAEGGLEKVKEAIEGMLRKLTQEQKDEAAKNLDCEKDFEANLASKEEKEEQRNSTALRLSEWKAEIKRVEGEMGGLKKELEDINEQLQAAQEERAKEKRKFAQMIFDEKTTQRLLSQAQVILSKVYEGTSFVEARSTRSTVPGYAVMEMLKAVQQKSERLEASAQQADEESQESFQALRTQLEEEIATSTKGLGKKSIVKSDLASDVAEGKRSIGLAEEELASLVQTKQALESSCQQVMQNFKATQKAREDEIEALKAARAILP